MAAPTITGTVSYGSTVGTATDFAISHTSNGDDLFVVIVLESEEAGTEHTVTFDGAPMDYVTHASLSGGSWAAFVYYLPAVSPATGDVEFTNVPVFGFTKIAIAAFNVNGAAPGTRIAFDTGHTSAGSVSLQGYTDELLLDVIGNFETSDSGVADAGQTELFSMSGTAVNQISLASSTKPASGITTLGWSWGGATVRWAQFVIALIGQTSGGGEHSAVF